MGGGDEFEEFTVDEIPLRHSSRFFEAAFSRDWKENEKKTLNLPDDRPVVFDIYLSHVYDYPSNMRQSRSRLNMMDALRAYVFGEKVMDQQFQDTIMENILTFADPKLKSRFENGKWLCKVIDILYKGLPVGHLGRRLVVDLPPT